MKIENVGEGFVLYSRSPDGKMALFLHGLSQGFDSPFAQEMIAQVVLHTDYSVLAFPFDFFREGTRPSPDLEREVAQLRRAISWACREYHVRSVTLIGKSLGGVVALAAAAMSDFAQETVEKICILGLPSLLGFPPRVELLNGGTPGVFDVQEEYQSLFQRLPSSLSVGIIQGSEDDLGPIPSLQELVRHFPNIALDIVPDVGHSFTRKDGSTHTACADALLKNMPGASPWR